ncbi:GNAT family N-acetyltransferase [Nocardioides dongxiaopingii]|uniref:GNAT family N-acetyltransferase n=1 Tax=Nocardioides dongxiaopingii TaxID=2576036 RepID=UPI0010C762D4|nr:GNAT family N-acetyltransferase [Nocardioides dongxiaopingii]
MTALALPDVRLRTTWAATLAEFAPALPGAGYPHGSGVHPGDPPALDGDGCAAFVAEAQCHADPAAALPDGRVHCTYFWVLDAEPQPWEAEDPMVGFVAVRHRLNDFLLELGGHIGYSVRPSRRGRGHAGRALGLALAHARGLGLDRALLTCDVDNEASRRTIERAGGVREDTRQDKHRYWVDLGPAPGHEPHPVR